VFTVAGLLCITYNAQVWHFVIDFNPQAEPALP
jgi:hypothetical protein